MCPVPEFEPGQRVWVIHRYALTPKPFTKIYPGEILHPTEDQMFLIVKLDNGHKTLSKPEELSLTDPRA